MKIDTRKIAEKIARDMFQLGSEPNDPAKRIEFKGGHWPEQETILGGLIESALVGVIDDSLRSIPELKK